MATRRNSIVTISNGGDIVETCVSWTGIIGNMIPISGMKTPVTLCSEFQRLAYKQCGYKVSPATGNPSSNFSVLHVFTKESFPKSHRESSGIDDDEVIIVFGKTSGKAGTENKYDFPPPIDNDIFYGKLCLVRAKVDNDDDSDDVHLNLSDLTVNQWVKMYSALFGGFYDCDENDSDNESEDDDDVYAELPTTKNGYAKDGFVVDDEDEDDESYYSEDEDEDFCLSDED